MNLLQQLQRVAAPTIDRHGENSCGADQHLPTPEMIPVEHVQTADDRVTVPPFKPALFVVDAFEAIPPQPPPHNRVGFGHLNLFEHVF